MSVELEKGLIAVLAGVGVARPQLPQPPTFPAIRYQRISTNRINSVDGSNIGVTEVSIQIDCMHSSYLGAKVLADSVREVLHGYIGAWGALTARFVHLQTENDLSAQDGDKVTHWVSQRYQIWTDMD